MGEWRHAGLGRGLSSPGVELVLQPRVCGSPLARSFQLRAGGGEGSGRHEPAGIPTVLESTGTDGDLGPSSLPPPCSCPPGVLPEHRGPSSRN